MPALLITDCLQHDFVGPIGRFEGLPNALHVGYDESRRLLGTQPNEGPVARVVAWAHRQPDDELRVIHVRDWHDPADPDQREHLQQFGMHCLHETPGAAFVFDTGDVAPGKQVDIVEATTLTNFVGTRLETLLAPFRGETLRVGLMGVWTEAKITFLAYDLRARYPHFELAVCSALTASSSRANHFIALDQLARVLGVRIIDSVGAFVDYLGGQVEESPLFGLDARRPHLHMEEGLTLAGEDLQLARYLFRDCREVRLRSLQGGYSGNRVLAARSTDLLGHEQTPHVVKIGAKGPIGQERTAFERIEHVLGNSAPRIVDFADLRERGVLKYRYAAVGRGPAHSLQKLYMAGATDQEITRILDAVFVDQLGRLYQAAAAERCDLLDYYGFGPQWAEGIRDRLTALLGAAGAEPELTFANGARLPNVVRFYEEGLASLPRVPRSHYFAYVHGDLNGANVLVDEPGNVWLIDFFYTHRGHVLRDLAKLENDLLYIWTPIESEDQLRQALALSDSLLDVRDLGRPLPVEPSQEVADEPLRRAYRTVRHLRNYYPALVHADREPTQLLAAQIRYAVHTLGFDESSAYQKRWALYTASLAAATLQRLMKMAGPLRVDWLPAHYSAPGRIGLTIVPGRGDYGRSLDDDLAVIRQEGIRAVVCLLARDEFERYGVDDLLTRYRSAGIEVLHLPTLDRTPPSRDDLSSAIHWIDAYTAAGGRVLVHCVGGLGRAGTVAAAWLTTRGLSADAAIDAVRKARSPRAIETVGQEEAVRTFVRPS